MPTRVRSFSKINLGLAIGPIREDGFHELTTMYQTLDLYDLVTVAAHTAPATSITLTTNHPHVPTDTRNTAWKMVERCLARLGVTAAVTLHIQKNLPVQGGLGAGSANAAAALFGLECELGMALDRVARLEMAAEVGSDVPLFLLGGTVLGLGRGEQVAPLPDLATMTCVVAVPRIGVSTPQAFRAWDTDISARALTPAAISSNLKRLSLAYASTSTKTGVELSLADGPAGSSEKQQSKLGHKDSLGCGAAVDIPFPLPLNRDDLQNDFETVVFPQYPSLREIKILLEASGSADASFYAALSGSGSALFGLYRSEADAKAAQHRVQSSGVQALLTATLPRSDYWRTMFAG